MSEPTEYLVTLTFKDRRGRIRETRQEKVSSHTTAEGLRRWCETLSPKASIVTVETIDEVRKRERAPVVARGTRKSAGGATSTKTK